VSCRRRTHYLRSTSFITIALTGYRPYSGRLVPYLPGAVHSFPRHHGLYSEGLFKAVCPSLRCIGSPGKLQFSTMFFASSTVLYQGNSIITSDLLSLPTLKLDYAHLIRFNAVPGSSILRGRLCLSGSVLPVIARDKFPPGYRTISKPSFYTSSIHPAKAHIICSFSQAIDAVIYGSPKMLNEGAVNFR
jgi:hypothetical protein